MRSKEELETFVKNLECGTLGFITPISLCTSATIAYTSLNHVYGDITGISRLHQRTQPQYCEYCGSAFLEGSHICLSCGAPRGRSDKL